MAYTKTQWYNNSSPAISAENLNKIEQGIYNNDVNKANASDVYAKTETYNKTEIDTSLGTKQGYFAGVNWVNIDNVVLRPGGEGYVLFSGRFKFEPQSGIDLANNDIVNYGMLQTALAGFLTSLPGYDATERQTLKNDNGTIQWETEGG